jgi:hypothetical protein
VHVRVAEKDGHLYLDLADSERRAVEITAEGWNVIHRPPVHFQHCNGMEELPAPVPGGSIEELNQFVNLRDQGQLALMVAWLVAALRPKGPYPILAFTGEQGSGKSSVSKLLRNLVDPNCCPLRPLPKSDRDLFIAAKNSHVLGFDNISNLPVWMADDLCRLATGSGFVTRKLRTDQDQVFLQAVRPIILNGIEDFIERPDLADRAILVPLLQIPSYRPEQELLEDFKIAQPRILGALLDGLVCGMKSLPGIRLNEYLRMADFVKLAVACEPAFWSPGTFMTSYKDNRSGMTRDMLETNPTACALRDFMNDRVKWEGTAGTLLASLLPVAGSNSKDPSWPRSPAALSKCLLRIEPVLRQSGIDVIRQRTGHSGTRLLKITRHQ